MAHNFIYYFIIADLHSTVAHPFHCIYLPLPEACSDTSILEEITLPEVQIDRFL